MRGVSWTKINICHKIELMQNEMSEYLHLREHIQKYLNSLLTHLTIDAWGSGGVGLLLLEQIYLIFESGENTCFFRLFVVPVTSGNGSIFTMSRFEKEHSSPNLKVTDSLPVVGSFLPLFKNFLRNLQLCHQ